MLHTLGKLFVHEVARLAVVVFPFLRPTCGIEGEKGKQRAGLASSPDPHFGLSDHEGKVRVGLDVFGGEPHVSLFDKHAEIRVDIGVRDPAVSLYDTDGRLRAALGATKLEMTRTGPVEQTPESSLVLFDKEGKVLWRAP